MYHGQENFPHFRGNKSYQTVGIFQEQALRAVIWNILEILSLKRLERLSKPKIGSHMDGNLKPIVSQLPECGLDVIESFSPDPLTPLTVEEAMDAWGDKPIIWGGIPCLFLEADAPLAELEDYVYGLLEMLAGRPMIFNVVDMVLPINEIDRVRRIAEIVEERAP